MDFYRSVSVSVGFPANYQPEKKLLSPSKLGSLDDLFSGHSMEQAEDINTEWLSIFVEDCLSRSGSCITTPKAPNPASQEAKAKEANSKLQEYNTEYPPLLHQAYWLADSELLVPKSTSEKKHDDGQGRRCTHCLSQRTPQWRAGPEGPKTLCNACGVRYKSGRLLPTCKES